MNTYLLHLKLICNLAELVNHLKNLPSNLAKVENKNYD